MNQSFEQTITEILEHDFDKEAKANMSPTQIEFVETTSWAGEVYDSKVFKCRLQAIMSAHKAAIRQANIDQIENWRGFIDKDQNLQWLYIEMNDAIKALQDPTLTDENGRWLASVESEERI